MSKSARVMRAVAVGIVLLTAPVVRASELLDFGIIAPTTGTIKYAVVGGKLQGVSISIKTITGIGTPLNSGDSLPCFNCRLNFTSGLIVGETDQQWEFAGGPGSTITVTGSLTAHGAPVTLLSGHFDDGPSLSVTALAGSFRIAGASFIDTKAASLLALFGLPADVPYEGGFNISFQSKIQPHNGSTRDTFISKTVLSGDAVNAPVTPEPTSLLLFATGLLGYRRLRARRAHLR